MVEGEVCYGALQYIVNLPKKLFLKESKHVFLTKLITLQAFKL